MKYSKHLSVIIFYLSYSIYGFGQNQTIDNYVTYDIRNSSCEIFNAINLDLATDYQVPLDNLKIKQQKQYTLLTENDTERYIHNFEQALIATKKENKTQEFLLKIEKEVGKYGLEVLSNYADELPSKHLTKFLAPAIKQGHEIYYEKVINEQIEKNQASVDKLIKDRINILYQSGKDVGTAKDEKAFNNMFEIAQADISGMDRNDYAIFNKQMTAKAYEFIKSNKEYTKSLEIKTENELNQLKANFNAKLDKLSDKIYKDVNTQFEEVGKSIANLTKNQVDIFNTLNTIQKRVKVNEVKIKVLEGEMKLVKNNINLLKKKQAEHRKLIAKNSFQIDILSGYAFQNLNTKDKINALDRGDFDNLFKDKKEKADLRRELKEIQTKETIISVANNVEQYSHMTYNGLVELGVLKGEDAKNVGKFMHGVSIAAGIARIYAGDFTGAMSVVSGISGLIGKPKPDPHMEMLKQMYNAMNERFDRVDEKLNTIETKIDTLTSITVNMYKTLVLSYQHTHSQLDRIIWKQDVLNRKATALLFRDYQACKSFTEVLQNRNLKFKTYSDYTQYYNSECNKCLEGLNDFTIGKNESYFYVSSNSELKSEDYIEYEINKVYTPTKELFYSINSSNINSAYYSLMFPIQNINNVNKPLFAISKIKNTNFVYDQNLEYYFNYPMIENFTDYMLLLGNYFLIKGNNLDLKPSPLDDYLKGTSINGINQDLLEKRLSKLSKIIQSSIAQQTMLSGQGLIQPIYSILFDNSGNKKQVDLCVQILNDNKILADNFVVYLIRNNIDFDYIDIPKVKLLFDEAINNENKLKQLNALIKVDDIRFVVNKITKKLMIEFKLNEKVVEIACPYFQRILDNQMIYSEAVYSLMENNQKINSKLFDLNFLKNLPLNNTTVAQFKYYYEIKEE